MCRALVLNPLFLLEKITMPFKVLKSIVHEDNVYKPGDELLPDSVPVEEGALKHHRFRFTRQHLATMVARGEVEYVADPPEASE
jgi:hypothetical protein